MLESGRREQTPPRRPKNLPRCFQDTPKTLPRPPKMTQDGPKTPPRDPKNPPRCPKLASGRFQNPPRRLQDASKTQFKRSKACPRHSRPLPEAPKVDFWRFWEGFGEVFLFQALTTFKKCATKFNSKFESKVPISTCRSHHVNWLSSTDAAVSRKRSQSAASRLRDVVGVCSQDLNPV